MKILKQRTCFGLLLTMLLMSMSTLAWGQALTASGVVSDVNGEPLIGVRISVENKAGVGAITDLDGAFSIKVDRSDILHFSYVGFKELIVPLKEAVMPLKVTLLEDTELLEEVVVIGYGTAKKEDLTGSITTITDKNFKKGLISTPDQLIAGKVAGVQITSGGGAPGQGGRIRIRGGASLNASNDPLIVIDGVPIDNNLAPGAPSILSSINPADIESMNVLKDASATAIYGSRASNGVIIITTKRGKLGQDIQVHFSSQFSLSTPSKFADVLTADEIREMVKSRGHQEYIDQLGDANTDWQKEIFRNAFGVDNNVSIAGSTSWLPYRASLGYYKEDGILKTGNMQRVSGDLSLNPRFFNGDLAVDINVKATQTRSKFASRDAIGAAISMDPTKPVYDPKGNKFGNYWVWLDGEVPNMLTPMNPVAILNTRDDRSTVNRMISNMKVNYKVPFIPDLRLNLNLGYDYTSSNGKIYVPTWAPQEYSRGEFGKGGIDNKFKQEKTNVLLDFYANYRKELKSLRSNIDVMAGYSYQDWKTNVYNYPDMTAGGLVISKPVFDTDYPRNTLVSFYGRLNYNLMERYLLTATVRTDGSSRFAKENRWGVFPSMAFAWKVKEEGFLKDSKVVSDLKLRLGYGVTGQQDGIANYSYIPNYNLSGNQSTYLFGDTYYNMYRPSAYDAEIKWEQTTTYNAGIDFGFLDGRLSGSIDVYNKYTKDLLNEIPIPAGANFSNRILTNVGNIENKGIEVTLNANIIETKDWHWDISLNATANKTRITKLTQTEDPSYKGVTTGYIKGATGKTIQIHSVNYAPNTFYVYKQVYDADNNPIEGVYADLNKDGKLNEQDKYHYKTPEPNLFLGASTSLSYKSFTISTALRASFGNYVYDNASAYLAVFRSVENDLKQINNTMRDIYSTNFQSNRYESDYYVKNASFLKMDNINLSYDFGRVWNEKLGIRLGATVQNVFTLTKYKGIDPEIQNGVDYQFYPVPRTYSLNVGLTF